MKLTKNQINTLRFALSLAAQWEDSLRDAWSNVKTKEADEVRADTAKNIKRFNALRKKLEQP